MLLHRILESAGFGFPNLVRDIIAGCRITGDMGWTGLFPEKFTGAFATMEDLWAHALHFRRSVIDSVRSFGSAEVDRDLYDQTVEEVALGRAAGPFTESELSERLGPRWFAARRFGVRQGNKTR